MACGSSFGVLALLWNECLEQAGTLCVNGLPRYYYNPKDTSGGCFT